MATTGTAVINAVNANLPGNAIFSATEKLAAVNAAIVSAWPRIVNEAIDSSVVLASTTYEYTPTATPELEVGFLHPAYVTLSNNPDVKLMRVGQRRNGTTWQIIVPADIASGFVGETLKLSYYATFPVITALIDTINMPLDYLEKYATFRLCLTAISKVGDFDRSVYEKLAPLYQTLAEQAAMKHETRKRGGLRIVNEQGISDQRSNRYGPYLT